MGLYLLSRGNSEAARVAGGGESGARLGWGGDGNRQCKSWWAAMRNLAVTPGEVEGDMQGLRCSQASSGCCGGNRLWGQKLGDKG